MRIIFLISLALLTFSGTMGAAYVQTHNPAMMRELLIIVDVFGISDAASDEQKRISAIKRLPIPYEQREALKKRTIFLGADQAMVVLALDQPKNIIKDQETQKETWVYYFEEDNRPTLLYFTEGKLTSAEKSSSLDVSQ